MRCKEGYKKSGNKCVRTGAYKFRNKFMKNPLFLILGIIGILALISLSVYFGIRLTNPLAITGVSSTNLVLNPGFDLGASYLVSSSTTSWTNNNNYWVYSGNNSKHTVTIDTTVYHSSSSSLRLSVLNGSKEWFTVKGNRIATSPGTKYLIEMYVKTSNLASASGLSNGTGGYPDRFMMEMQEYNATATESTSRVRAVGGIVISGDSSSHANWDAYKNKDWVKISGVYTVGSGVTYIRPGLYFYSTNGNVWFDDVSIKQLTESTAVVNGSIPLDNQNAEIWAQTSCVNCSNVPVGWTSQYGREVSQSIDKYEGAYSIDFKKLGSDTPWIGFENAPLTKGTLYEFSAYVKLKSGTGSIFAQRKDNWASLNSVSFTKLNEWQKVSVKFVASNYTGNYRLGLKVSSSGNSSAETLIDKAELKILKTNVPTCSVSTTCEGSEYCFNGYCTELSCVSGYHANNHMCEEDGFIRKNPALSIVIGVIAVLLVAVLILVLRRKRK
jgi:hypothetical protein